MFMAMASDVLVLWPPGQAERRMRPGVSLAYRARLTGYLAKFGLNPQVSEAIFYDENSSDKTCGVSH